MTVTAYIWHHRIGFAHRKLLENLLNAPSAGVYVHGDFSGNSICPLDKSKQQGLPKKANIVVCLEFSYIDLVGELKREECDFKNASKFNDHLV